MTPPASPSIPWSQLKDTLNTGDVLAFSGNDGLDYAIKLIEGEPYTHVGIVIKIDGKLFFWDAPGGGKLFADPVSKHPAQTGARVADLNDVISYYMTTGGETEMWVRRLTPAATADQQASLMTFVKVADGIPFPGSELTNLPEPWNLGEGFSVSWLLGTKMKTTVAGSFFCAQLAAQSYMAMGILPIAPWPANAYDPASFESDDPKVLPLIGNTLAAKQVVTYP